MLAEAGCRRPIEPRRALLGPVRGPELLHVGSTIARKRIDVLLKVFHADRWRGRTSRLIRVGGPFTPGEQLAAPPIRPPPPFTREQSRMAVDLGIRRRITVLPFLDRAVLAAVYRRATLALMTSEREGFGLPLVEAMACGTPVVASDIAALREVGGDAACYASVGDLDAWRRTVTHLLDEKDARPVEWARRRDAALARASLFSWSAYARRMEALYTRLAGDPQMAGAAR